MFDDITQVLLSREVILISMGIFSLIFGVQKAFPKLRNNKIWMKMLPILPLILGCCAVFMPGVLEGYSIKEQWGSMILVGMWSGFVTAQGRKIVKRLVLEKIEDNAN